MGEHLVQFYEDEAALVDEIWRFIEPCLHTGDVAVVIASKERLDHLERKFSPILPGSASSHYLLLDAEQTLARIMSNDWPDVSLFKAVLGDVMKRASQNGKQRVRVYGELVAMLCAQGKQEAAIRLEQMWSELACEYSLSLLCGCPLSAFPGQEDTGAFEALCNAHTRVHPAESFRTSASEDALHRRIAMLQQKAYALESEVARRKEIERKLHRLEQDLAEMDRRNDGFLAALGHELRNPLAPIMNSIELMRINSDATALERSCETIARQVSNLQHLVDNLLDASRIARGKIELKMEKVSLDSVVERAVEIVRPLIDERRHHLTLNLPATPVYIPGDSTRLAQVLANLLHNAAKYTEAGGCISFSAREEKDFLVLSVSDNGIGIAPELHEKIFDLFVQNGGPAPKVRSSLGLGLPLVRGLVQLHRGTVQVHSAGDGCGSNFIVTLPLKESPIRSCTPPGASLSDCAPQCEPRKCTVLIVDDNIDAAESLSEFLKVLGHHVHVANDGPSAIDKALQLRPDVVILDIGMPTMNGYQVARYLRTEAGLTSSLLIAVTGYTEERDRLSAQQAGFDHHFAKPLDIGKLTKILDSRQDQ